MQTFAGREDCTAQCARRSGGQQDWREIDCCPTAVFLAEGSDSSLPLVLTPGQMTCGVGVDRPFRSAGIAVVDELLFRYWGGR